MPCSSPAARSTKPLGRCVIALFIALFASTALAQTERYQGVVVKADPTTHSLVVKNAQTGGRFRFSVTPNTLILLGNQTKTLPDVIPGSEVAVDYIRVAEKYQAQRIEILAAGAGP